MESNHFGHPSGTSSEPTLSREITKRHPGKHSPIPDPLGVPNSSLRSSPSRPSATTPLLQLNATSTHPHTKSSTNLTTASDFESTSSTGASSTTSALMTPRHCAYEHYNFHLTIPAESPTLKAAPVSTPTPSSLPCQTPSHLSAPRNSAPPSKTKLAHTNLLSKASSATQLLQQHRPPTRWIQVATISKKHKGSRMTARDRTTTRLSTLYPPG